MKGITSLANGPINVVAALPEEKVNAFCTAFRLESSTAPPRPPRRGEAALPVQHHPSGVRAESGRDDSRDHAVQRIAIERGVRLPAVRRSPRGLRRPEDVIIKKWNYREGGSEKHLPDVARRVEGTSRQPRGSRLYFQDWTARLGLSAEWPVSF